MVLDCLASRVRRPFLGEELERAIAQDAREQMAKTLGAEVYQWLHSLSRVYLRLCRKVASKPDQDMTKQVEQIYQLLASAKKLRG